ncbi:LacI family DNA-binding transcriptional regulator [Coraliomargarita algicola]|uniref:LacI family DNA-binding transcriptional regulator n=1 Tax=Coraliomargarita algicola TaxID=3092156 RepID=A0ABZ0RLJ9_9BACT|nr:LacI family DNA-binding transcriptional regulator [Coraliomargarita sp. J2-16]WPJ97095.1 LacI family DNA-binding transcriptional regulator [Coraliomargarita sp. J2-16]
MENKELKGSRRITMAQIAAHAGVSKTTVSFVLNNSGSVGEETAARVHRAARELGYIKPVRAKAGIRKPDSFEEVEASLSSRETIAIIWVNTTESWRHSHLSHLLIHTLDKRFQEFDSRMKVIFYNEGEGDHFPSLSGVSALFVAGSPSSGFWKKLPAGLPRLNLLCKPFSTSCSFLDIDSLHTGYELTQYLIEKGHRRIGFVSNSRHHRSFNLRYLGYYRALDELEIVPQADWVVRLSRPSGTLVETTQPARDVEPLVAKMLSLPQAERPTAIVAANDWNAAAIYQYAHRIGLRIPEDLSVVGCDNDPGVCDFLTPALTTFAIPYVDLANEAADWMCALLQGKSPHSQPSLLHLRGQLIERDSVGAPS